VNLHALVDRAFGPIIWPILGIIFLPWTTLLYAILWNPAGEASRAGNGSSSSSRSSATSPRTCERRQAARGLL